MHPMQAREMTRRNHMTEPTQAHDPFPPSDFDRWAARYDQDVANPDFPFTGYQRVLSEVGRLADVTAGMSVLDLAAGTGNLAERFMTLGCELWGTDFSANMLEAARKKLPSAAFFPHDLRQPFPPALQRRFDRIVSAYVFHHFELPEKAALVRRLVDDHLEPGGRLVIADVSFLTREELQAVRQSAGDAWDEEP
jgi:cyclopropane fatty-acyl-phospholipid synthase-like methyltransferase